MQLKLTTNSGHYYNEFFIVKGTYYDTTYFAGAHIRLPDGSIRQFDDFSCIEKFFYNLDAYLEENGKQGKYMIVTVNREFKKFLPADLTHIKLCVFNNLITDYTSYRPPMEKYNIYMDMKQFKICCDQILFYTQYLPTSCLRDTYDDEDIKGNRTSAGIARELLDKWYGVKGVFIDKSIKNLAKNNFHKVPYYDFFKEVVRKNMEFNASSVLCRNTANSETYNINKWDINSSYLSILWTRETGGRPKYVHEKKTRQELNNFKSHYLNSNKIFFAKVYIKTIVHFTKPELDIFKTSEINYMGKPIIINHIQWELLMKYSDLNMDDIEIIKYWECTKIPFLPEQKEIIIDLHKRKAVAKSEGNEIMKHTIKVVTYSGHGYGVGKWYDKVEGEDAYMKLWYKGIPYGYARRFYTCIDSLILYTGAAARLYDAIAHLDKVTYYDADMVCIPAELDYQMEEINNKFLEDLKAAGINPEELTHSGHTIGLFEKEAEYECFYNLGPKMYFYVEKGKAHLGSTTAGYPKNLIAHAIEEKSQLIGYDALKWFIEQDEFEITVKDNIGYLYNAETGYTEPITFKKSNYMNTNL